MAEHTSSHQPSPTVSTPDFPDLDDLIREEWNRRNQNLEAAKKPNGRCGSNEDSRGGGFGSSSSAKRRSIDLDSPDKNGSSAKRRSISQSSPTLGSSSRSSSSSIKITNQGQRRNSSSSSSSSSIKINQGQRRNSSSIMDNNTNNNNNNNNNNKYEPSSGKGEGEGNTYRYSYSYNPSHSSIPPLNDNVAVAIFVPLTNGQALLSPPAAATVVPETPPYFLEKLERLTTHEAAVRGNIEALFGLEYLRVRAHVATAYPDDSAFDYYGATAAVRPVQEADLRQDLDAMIGNMRSKLPDPPVAGNLNLNLAAAAAAANLNLNLTKDVGLPDMDVPITYHPLNSPREAAANDVLKLLGDAATQLGFFDNHIRVISDGIKKEMQDAAARELREKQDRMDTD
ncbi:hypothetical protein MKX07_005631 [Trichoderma sp. CBMAI-0711]|nr:hypothetical protein MKX07_005631 [Trichoderma sp. CBMAI-0711]